MAGSLLIHIYGILGRNGSPQSRRVQNFSESLEPSLSSGSLFLVICRYLPANVLLKGDLREWPLK